MCDENLKKLETVLKEMGIPNKLTVATLSFYDTSTHMLFIEDRNHNRIISYQQFLLPYKHLINLKLRCNYVQEVNTYICRRNNFDYARLAIITNHPR